MKKLRVLDLFSGIGGFSLGLERTGGFETVAFCEIEPFPRRVLAKHWPGVPIYDDVRTLTGDKLKADGICVDVICGGFPCQDISTAGHGAGIEGERSGLWSEFARLIGELRPRYVIVENVAALLHRGLDRVLGDLAALGFDAEWHCIPAAAVGAPHRRDRVWIVASPTWIQPRRSEQWSQRQRIGAGREPITVAHPDGDQLRQQPGWRHGQDRPGQAFAGEHGQAWALADANSDGEHVVAIDAEVAGASQSVADADLDARHQWRAGNASQGPGRRHADRSCFGQDVADADGQPPGRLAITWREYDHWQSEPDVGRVAHGISHRVDRLAGLGNAVVPQIPDLIGRAILDAEAAA